MLLILGVWLAILPYLGFPYSWKDTLTTISGLILICFSYILYQDYKRAENQEKTFDNFRENSDFSEHQNQNTEVLSTESAEITEEQI